MFSFIIYKTYCHFIDTLFRILIRHNLLKHGLFLNATYEICSFTNFVFVEPVRTCYYYPYFMNQITGAQNVYRLSHSKCVGVPELNFKIYLMLLLDCLLGPA